MGSGADFQAKTKEERQAELRANILRKQAEAQAKRLIDGRELKNYDAAVQKKQEEIKIIQSGGTTKEIQAQEQYLRDIRDGVIKSQPAPTAEQNPSWIGNGNSTGVFNTKAPKMGENEDPTQYQIRLLSWQRDEARAAHLKAVDDLTHTRKSTGVKTQQAQEQIDQLKQTQAAANGAGSTNPIKTLENKVLAPGRIEQTKRVTSQYQKRMDQLEKEDKQDAAARANLKGRRQGQPFRGSKNQAAEYSLLAGQRKRKTEKETTAAVLKKENQRLEIFSAASKDESINPDEASNAIDQQIADINANVVGNAINPYTGTTIAKGTLPDASGFGTEFFPQSQDLSDADQFLRLGEKFGISPEVLQGSLDQVDAEAEEQKMLEEKINSDNKDAELAIIEAEKVRQAETSRQAKAKAAEILGKADDRTRGILSRFGATDSTAGAAIFAFNQKSYQEAITQLEVEDAVFNKEMLAATLNAQIRFNKEKLTIEKDYANDKATRVEKTREFAMDYMKQFLDYRKNKEDERFKVGELVFKEQMAQAREQQKTVVDSAMNLFDEYGSDAIPQLQSALAPYGVDLSSLEGRKTFSQLKNEYDLNKPYYNPSTGKGGGGGNGVKLSGITAQLADMVGTGALGADQVMTTYFSQFGSTMLEELGADIDEALLSTDASGFVQKYEQLGLLKVNDEQSTKKPLLALLNEGTATFELPQDYIDAVQSELDVSNSNNRAPFTAAEVSNIIRKGVNRHNGVIKAVEASPQYYQQFEQLNAGTESVRDSRAVMESLGAGGAEFAKENYKTVSISPGDVGAGPIDTATALFAAPFTPLIDVNIHPVDKLFGNGPLFEFQRTFRKDDVPTQAQSFIK